jgi:hypothetical protein
MAASVVSEEQLRRMLSELAVLAVRVVMGLLSERVAC